MDTKQVVLIGIALMLLFTGVALATSTTASATSDVIIYAFDQNKTPREAMKATNGLPFTTYQMKAWT